VIDIDVAGFASARDAGLTVLYAEAWRSDRHLLERAPERVSELVDQRLRAGAPVSAADEATARARKASWLAELADVFQQVEVLALPSVGAFPPAIGASVTRQFTAYTRPGNLAGTPSLALPVPVPLSARRPETAHLPAGLQLMGPLSGEEALVRLGARIEAAVSP